MAKTIITENKLRVIDLKKEYGDSFQGEEKYAVFSDLTKEELLSAYNEELKPYMPFCVVKPEMFEVFSESIKDGKRRRNQGARHPEISFELAESALVDPLEEPAIICESTMAIEYIVSKMLGLPERQGTRMYKRYILGYSAKEISKSENASLVSVLQSLQQGRNALHNVFVELGVV